VQGQGLATEAVRAMTTWGLHRLSLPEVLGIVAADNVSSCRVLEKAGFVRCGEDGGVRVIYRCSASSEES
jgi:RimJ/RimL family protein N-acetyltransferase